MPTTTGTPHKRKRRFERTTDPVPLQLVPRDIEILKAVATHRFLNSRQVQALIPGSADKILRRLDTLFHAGYLDRPRAQLDFFATGGGSKVMVYALADHGARLLNAELGGAFPEVNWGHKNQSAGRPFIEHTIAIADTHVALHVATRKRPDIERVAATALIAEFPQPPASLDRAFLQRVQVRHNDEVETIAVNPDLAFGLRSAAIGRRVYLVECDRGTMPVARSTLKISSLMRKFKAYIAAYNARLHVRQFGWQSYRVLMIVNSPERAENASLELQRITTARNLRQLFYFAESPVLATCDILTHTWIDGNGQPQTLMEGASRLVR